MVPESVKLKYVTKSLWKSHSEINLKTGTKGTDDDQLIYTLQKHRKRWWPLLVHQHSHVQSVGTSL